MSSAAPTRPKVPVTILIALCATILVAGFALYYLNHRPSAAQLGNQVSQEARSYVRDLQLSDVTMQATENFMNQQVVEVQGKIANQGTKALRSVEVYCLFQSIDGKQIGRERLPIVRATNKPLNPGEVRPFRLPFDSVPDGWNQAMPRLVIAHIDFVD